MANKLNNKGFNFAKELISKGKYKITSEWNPPTPEEENDYIEKNGWDAYSRWHLGYDSEIDNDETKAKWKYPFTSDFENVDRRGLIAIRQRAGQQGDDDIFEAAGKLLEMIDEKEGKEFKVNITKQQDNTFTAIASKEVVDRMGDIVKIDGIKIDNYLRNPVILFNHFPEKVIGKAVDVLKTSDSLIVKIQFANTPLAQEIKELVAEGFLNTLSIGFMPLQYKPNDNGNGIVYESVELLEVSIVSIPANPEAVVLRYLEDRLNAKAIKLQNAISEEKIRRLQHIYDRIRKANNTSSSENEDKEKKILEKIKELRKKLQQ
jgi:HK97 family phage prohead protease